MPVTRRMREDEGGGGTKTLSFAEQRKVITFYEAGERPAELEHSIDLLEWS
jgi:hypothetical protein